MINKYNNLESEIQKLISDGKLTNANLIELFKRYESSNIKSINKLRRRKLVEKRRISGALKQTINAHGAITKTLINSATKRIYGALLSNNNPTIEFHLNSFIWGVIVGSLTILLLL